MISYREFTRADFKVKIFERDNVPGYGYVIDDQWTCADKLPPTGGNWHYTESDVPMKAPIPNADVAVGDYSPSLPPDGVDLPYSEIYLGESEPSFGNRRREHRAPKPVWKSLKSNAPAVSSGLLGQISFIHSSCFNSLINR